jgi:uncharacterized membrane protein YeiH
MSFQVALWIELLAAGLGGLQGALFAANFAPGSAARVPGSTVGAAGSAAGAAGSAAEAAGSAVRAPGSAAGAAGLAPGSAGDGRRRIDVLGVIVIGLAVALGGSLLRDIVLDQPPVVIWQNWYLPVAGGAAVLGMTVAPVLARAGRLITVLDAVVMGLFGAIGASKALSLGVGEAGALVAGVIGAIGGGMLRDVILSLPISFLEVGSLYAVAAGTGVATFVLLTEFGTPTMIAGLICVAVTSAVRLAAVHFDWVFPEQRPIRPRRRRSPSTPGSGASRRRGNLSTPGSDAP